MPSIVCQRCHSVNEPNAVICQKCGARFCPSCHLIIESPDASVCPHCGKKDLSFRPGKFTSDSSSGIGSQSYCSNCGSKIEPGARKCPYCGRLGNLVTQTPTQGFGVMKPADGGAAPAYFRPEPETPSRQKVCRKCGTPIPPGSSMCPVHGKFGGGSVLRDETAPTLGKHTGDIWRRIEEKRAASAEAEQMRAQPRHTGQQDIYPQMHPGSIAPQDIAPHGVTPQSYTGEQRICPNCSSPVPDRSKICPTCGSNRLPMQKSGPMLRAEEYYKSQVATVQAYPPFSPPADQPYAPPANQYYGQPAVQPYEMARPAPMPGLREKPRPEKKRLRRRRREEADRAESRPKQIQRQEGDEEEGEPKQKKSPLPILLALIALAGVIIISIVLIMDQLKPPPPAVLSPKAIESGTIVPKAPVITNIQFSNITQNSAVVTWQTDKKSNSIVIHCLETGSQSQDGAQCVTTKDNGLVTDHKVSLSDLQAGKSYHITVQSQLNDDPNAPTSASLDATSVLVASDVRDTTPPVITGVKPSNIVSSSTAASATIEWITDEPATSQVSYGTSATYGSLQPSSSDTTLVKDHSETLNGLSLQTTFHYKVRSRDAAGNEAESKDASFVTPAASGTGIGQPGPDFTLQCADGQEVTLSSLHGNKVILNFWSLGCPYCDLEMPALQKIHEDNPNIHVLSVCGPQMRPVDKPVVGSKIEAFTFTVPLDESGTVGQLYNVTSGVPVTYILDSNGLIKAFKNGAFMNGSSEIQSLLNSFN